MKVHTTGRKLHFTWFQQVRAEASPQCSAELFLRRVGEGFVHRPDPKQKHLQRARVGASRRVKASATTESDRLSSFVATCHASEEPRIRPVNGVRRRKEKMFIAALTAASLAGVPEGDLVLTRAQLEGTNLRYTLDSASWQGLVVRDAPATLAVFQGQELLWSAPLNNASGTIQLPQQPRGNKAISVQLFALRGAWMVRSTNGKERMVIRAAATQGHGGHAGHGQGHGGHSGHGSHGQGHGGQGQSAFLSSAISACDDAFYSANFELECVAAARDFRVDPAPVIDACDDAFYGESQLLACVESAPEGRDISLLIQACDDAFYDDTNTQRCIQAASQASARHAAPPIQQMQATIEACDDALYSTTHQLSCIEQAVGVWNAGPMVQSCDAAYYGELDVIRCLQTAYMPRREEDVEVVDRGHQRPVHPRG